MLPLILVLAAWGDLRPEGVRAVKGPGPKSAQRKEALEEFQQLLSQWQRERNEFSAEVALQAHAEARIDFSREHPEEPAIAGGTPSTESKKPTRAPRSKVLEFSARPRLEVELEEAEAAANERTAECEKNLAKCQAERRKRSRLEEADDAFEAAIEKNFEKRRAKIEAEGAKMQADFEAARKREANREMKKLGGAVDDEGNFVDDELKAEPPPRRSE